MNEGDFRSLSKKELQVRISHVVSPSKIFIQWLSSEHTLKRYLNREKFFEFKTCLLQTGEVQLEQTLIRVAFGTGYSSMLLTYTVFLRKVWEQKTD